MVANKKSKTKTKVKLKAKAKSSGKAKAKTPVKAKAKSAAKLKVKTKSNSQAKTGFKGKAAGKAKSMAKAKSKVVAPKGILTKIRATSVALTPLEDRVVVMVHGPAEKTAGGIIIPGTVSERPNQGKILAVGRGRRNKKGHVRPLDVSVGQDILFPQFAGTPIQLDGEEYLILREEEVLGIVT